MGQVSVTVNGRSYHVACDDGQESHLIKLANYVDQKVGQLSDSVGQIGDTRLLLMASIMIADEIFEIRTKLEKSRPKANGNAEEATSQEFTQIMHTLENLSKRLVNLADSIESH